MEKGLEQVALRQTQVTPDRKPDNAREIVSEVISCEHPGAI